MEEKKKQTVETISKEEIDKVIDSLKKTKKRFTDINGISIDLDKVQETLASFESCTPYTIACILSTAMFLLPVSVIEAILNMGKATLKAKVLADFMQIIENKCGCSESQDKEETPKE